MLGVGGQWMTLQEGAVEDARQAGGGQRDKREDRECETSRWQAMQGDRVANNMTRGGGRMPAIILKTMTGTTMQNLHQQKQRNQGRCTPAPPWRYSRSLNRSALLCPLGGVYCHRRCRQSLAPSRRPARPTSQGCGDEDNQPIGGPWPAPCCDAVKDGRCNGVLR
jgi:hypothetical protein